MAQLSHVIEIRRKPKEVFELLGDPTRDATDTGTRVTFIGNVRLRRALRLFEPLAVRFGGGRVDRDLEAVKRRPEAT